MSGKLHDDGSMAYVTRKLLEVGPSRIQGLGLFARKAYAQGEHVIEYSGERISKTESIRRCSEGNHFIFHLDDEHDLDGSGEFNLARYINHHCAPNCSVESIEGRLWVIAGRNIVAGEELSFDYGYDLSDYREYPCNCGASNCVGYILAEEFRNLALSAPPTRESTP